jgi:hypothetical protein
MKRAEFVGDDEGKQFHKTNHATGNVRLLCIFFKQNEGKLTKKTGMT